MSKKETYHVKILGQQTLLNGTTRTSYQVYRNDHKEMTADELKKITQKLTEKAPEGAMFNVKGIADLKKDKQGNVQIRGLAPDKWTTLKHWNDESIRVQDEDEYFEGKVRDTGKFQKYYQAEISLIKPPSKKK